MATNNCNKNNFLIYNFHIQIIVNSIKKETNNYSSLLEFKKNAFFYTSCTNKVLKFTIIQFNFCGTSIGI